MLGLWEGTTMIEREVDLWKFRAAAVVITTNGRVKKNGEAVMGRGCAREASLRWPGLPLKLGKLIKETGNHVYALEGVSLGVAAPDEIDEMPGAITAAWDTTLVTFPVKSSWQEAAKVELIARSAGELVELADQHGWDKVVMPRPGCGNGQLGWDIVIEDCEHPNLRPFALDDSLDAGYICPDCHGQISAEACVKRVLAPLLDDRFVVVTYPEIQF